MIEYGYRGDVVGDIILGVIVVDKLWAIFRFGHRPEYSYCCMGLTAFKFEGMDGLLLISAGLQGKNLVLLNVPSRDRGWLNRRHPACSPLCR
jgi:hypothetical protein